MNERGAIMRGTQHNARKGKKGVFSAKHNDRNFHSGERSKHIDAEKTTDNQYIRWGGGKYETNEAAETAFYEIRLIDGLNAKNERYLQKGHKERCQTIEEYRKNAKSCPEEVIEQIGTVEDTIDAQTLWTLAKEQALWEMKTFPQMQILDVSLHVDEPECAPHIHKRRVWVGHDKDGNEIIGQAKALEEMGIERPDPSKPVGRYNNAKQTFTRMCRQHYIELCRQHGIELETEPKEASEVGLTHLEYKRRKEEAKLEAAREQVKTAHQELETLEHQKNTTKGELTKMEQDRGMIAQDVANMDAERAKLEEDINTLKNEKIALEDKIEGIKAELKEKERDIAIGRLVEHAAKTQKKAPEMKKTLDGSTKVAASMEQVQAAFAALQISQDLDERRWKQADKLKKRAAELEAREKEIEDRAHSLDENLASARLRALQGTLNRLQREYPEIFEQERQELERQQKKKLLDKERYSDEHER
jgi:hypothetical protein